MAQEADRKLQPAIFLDRDGTMNVDIGYVSSPDELEIYPWAPEAVRMINHAGFKAIVVTNQSGVARGLYTEETLASIHHRLMSELERGNAYLDEIYYCPHHPRVGGPSYRMVCDCRKPLPGMLRKAERELRIDLQNSFVIGDKASDVELAKNGGTSSVLVLTGYGRETVSNPELWPCKPDFIAEDLLSAVKRVLDTTSSRR